MWESNYVEPYTFLAEWLVVSATHLAHLPNAVVVAPARPGHNNYIFGSKMQWESSLEI